MSDNFLDNDEDIFLKGGGCGGEGARDVSLPFTILIILLSDLMNTVRLVWKEHILILN